MDENLRCLLHMELEGLFDPRAPAAAAPERAPSPAAADQADAGSDDARLADAVCARLRQPEMRATLGRLATQLGLH